MKKLIATLAMVASVTANADAMLGFNVEQFETNKNGTVNLYGKCGNAAIGLSDVEVRDEFIVGTPDSELMMVNPTTGKQIKIKSQLSDYNKFACFITAKGHRVVVGSVCGGSACGDAYNYHVVDTGTMKILNKKAVQEVKDLDRILNGK